MGQDTSGSRIAANRPTRSISRRLAEPILYLAEQMASIDHQPGPKETRVVDVIAKAMGIAAFRREPWFREMSEAAAVGLIDTDLAKRAALVVLSLVLKADMKRTPAEKAYFTRIREALNAPPVTVPVDLDEHRRLALEFFVEGTARSVSSR